jgi:YVTN family beta-propeller protein
MIRTHRPPRRFVCRRAAVRVPVVLAAASCLLLAAPGAVIADPIATIPVGTEPVGVAVNSATDKVYVATRADDAVTVIQGLEVIATAPVGTFPRQVAVNPIANKVYVTNFESDDFP